MSDSKCIFGPCGGKDDWKNVVQLECKLLLNGAKKKEMNRGKVLTVSP